MADQHFGALHLTTLKLAENRQVFRGGLGKLVVKPLSIQNFGLPKYWEANLVAPNQATSLSPLEETDQGAPLATKIEITW